MRNRAAEEVSRLVQTQLNLVHQVFHTKATVFCSSKGILVRYICFISLVATLATFLTVIVPRSSHQIVDITLTCLFLIGTIFLEVCSYITLFSSDWRNIWLMHLKISSKYSENITEFLALTMTRYPVIEMDSKSWSLPESMGQ